MAKKFNLFDDFRVKHVDHIDVVPEVDEWKLVLICGHKVSILEPCIIHHHVIITQVKSSWTFDFVRSLYNSPRFIVDSVEYISSFSVDNDKH